jgi:DNA processing protein
LTKNLEELRAIIGLKMCEGIGDISAYKLISHCGSAAAVFEEKKKHLSNISGISTSIPEALSSGIDWEKVDKEVDFIEKKHINYVTILDRNYPSQLMGVDSPPVLLFFTGSIERLNTTPCISIVGTRNATGYGVSAVAEIINSLKDFDVTIISGLALGIDITSHKASLQNNISTFGVVGHGLKTVYPPIHAPYAKQMAENRGGIISEFFSDEIPNRENFPKRNRIIAGLSFATIVIEASKKSGTLITAELAVNYKKQVYALPGRYNDKYSEGCNFMIKERKVQPILSIHSLTEDLGFKRKKKTTPMVPLTELSPEEQSLVDLIMKSNKISLDNISHGSGMNISQCSAVLFNLELKGLVRSLPGKSYELF